MTNEERLVGLEREVDLRRQPDRVWHLEALERVVASVMEDIRLHLTTVHTVAEVADAEVAAAADGPRAESLQVALDAASRAARLCHHLLALARSGSPPPRPLDLAPVVRAFEGRVGRGPGSVEVTVEAPAPLVVMGHRVPVDLAVAHLVQNAVESMPEGGRVGVVLGLEEVGPRSAAEEAGRYAVIDVRDEGAGMDKGTVARATEPFFTTRPGHRPGLGLAIVRDVARMHGGFLRIDSVPGRGTTVRLALPLADASEPVE